MIAAHPRRLEYCHYLLVSQVNYTLTNYAEYSKATSHDAINRFLRKEKMTPSTLGGRTLGSRGSHRMNRTRKQLIPALDNPRFVSIPRTVA